MLLTSIVALPALGQCTDGFVKLFPENTTDFSLEYGKSISMYDNYLAVGVPGSDTVGRQSGIVYIYEKKSMGWAKIASMTASSPISDLRLGVNVKLSKNYLLASAEGSGGQVFIYKKPVGGWVSSTEMTILSVAVSESFGTAYSHPVDISEDENTIAVADALIRHNFNPTTIGGSLYVYHKAPAQEWSNSITPVEIKATQDMMDFGRSGIYVSGTRIITGTPFTPSDMGNLYVYNDPSGTFTNLTLEALLSSAGFGLFWMDNLVVLDDGIMASGTVGGQLQLMFFKRPNDGIWVNAQPTSSLDPDGRSDFNNSGFIHLATNGTDLYTTSRNTNGARNLTRITRGINGWATPVFETIDYNTSSPNGYGVVLACNLGTNVAVGHVAHPLNGDVINALKVYSKTPTNTWTSSTLFSEAGSTRDHRYGSRMIVQDDWMFVSATRDNTVKAGAGKVYVYHKNGLQWEKVSSIEPDARVYGDKDFGSALAANSDFLAVGAINWYPIGSVFIYKRNGNVWSGSPYQEIVIPSAPGDEILSYGDNLAMSDRWLLIPYGNYGTNPEVKVAIYEYDGASWVFRQSVGTGWYDFFAKFATIGVDIEGNTFVARGKVFELDNTGKWVNTAELSPTDPENLRFNFPYFELLHNGSNFGQTVVIKDQTVFIGAPRKDYEGIWDVGAVYVYKKLPGGPWKDRTESGKIIPEVIQESGLFGASISSLESSLVIGAPVSEYFKNGDLNGDVKKNVPGKAMVFQARDAAWKSWYQVKTFTGETGILDNFGNQVYMDENKVYISAPMEDIKTGRISGSVYISDKPPALYAIPDLCSTALEQIALKSKPAGGTWSGPGIIDPVLGIFDPVAAGVGKHEITYTLPGCMLNGKIDITILSKPTATLDVDSDQLVCENYSIYVPLNVTPVPGCDYQWYYRKNESEPFGAIDGVTASIATQRGDYLVKVYNTACETFSDIISVHNESMELELHAPGKVCSTPVAGLELSASPPGGVWSGPGVSNVNRFSINGIPDGNVTLSYRYSSPRGCQYVKDTVVLVERITPPTIDRVGNLCREGVVNLSFRGAEVSGTIYSWNRRGNDEGVYAVAGSGRTLETSLNGTYILSAMNGECAAESAPVVINDTFSVTVSPESERSAVCYGQDFQFSFSNQP